MGKTAKHLLDSTVEGTLSGISHIFYMSGKDSKFFFIEIKPTLDEKSNEGCNVCTIIARTQNLHASILDLQNDRNISIASKATRYSAHQHYKRYIMWVYPRMEVLIFD